MVVIAECVDLQFIPRGKWYCRSCELKIRKEENAKPNANAIAAGRVAGIDPFEEIKKRCIRILDTIEQDDGGCVLCRCIFILCFLVRKSVVYLPILGLFSSFSSLGIFGVF